jgi:hypothetical protein
MQIPILIEHLAGNGYRGRGGEPFPFTVEGTTREEVLRKMRELVDSRIAAGAQLVQLEVPSTERPWTKFAGTWTPDDPVIEEWKQAVEEYRRQMDEDPDVR